jgi:hypothetical protein
MPLAPDAAASNHQAGSIAALGSALQTRDKDPKAREFPRAVIRAARFLVCLHPFFGPIQLVNLISFFFEILQNFAEKLHFNSV